MQRPSRVPDTPLHALATGPTPKRPGHTRPIGFTGGNRRGVCVQNALRRPKPRSDDSLNLQQKGHKPCSI